MPIVLQSVSLGRADQKYQTTLGSESGANPKTSMRSKKRAGIGSKTAIIKIRLRALRGFIMQESSRHNM